MSPQDPPSDKNSPEKTQAERNPPAERNEAGSPTLSARSISLDLMDAVFRRRKPLDEALGEHAELENLAPRDRQFVRALVTTTLRHLGQIDHALGQCLEKPLPARALLVRNILRLGAAQIMFLSTAPHAAVDTMVTLAAERGETGFKGLINAVLRRISRDPQAFLNAAPAGAVSLPDWLWQSWVKAYGVAKATQIATAHLYEPPLDFCCRRPAEAEYWAGQLHARLMPLAGTLRRPVASEAGDRLHQRVEDLPGYAEGAWWVQDMAAQIPARLLGNVAGRRVIDLCAAPGGKTAQLAAAGAQVTALDRSRQRLARVKENLDRLKLHAELEVADAALWDRGRDFDAVLLDAPCSATGTIRRHPDVAWLKDPRDLAKLSATQDRLLDKAVSLLAPGGTLIYCTCSLQPEEGPARIEALLKRQADLKHDRIHTDEVGGLFELISPAGDFRSLPSHLADQGGLDGFFAARIVKAG
jgi:16S rRNA (cytosine967-C5)-methyltransferase